MTLKTITLGDSDAKRLDKLDDGDSHAGAFQASALPDSHPDLSDFIINTMDPGYAKFREDALKNFLKPFAARVGTKRNITDIPANAGLMELYAFLESPLGEPSCLVKEPTTFTLLGETGHPPDRIPNAVPYEWIKRYFEKMAIDKDKLFSAQNFEHIRRLADVATDDNQVSRTEIEALIRDAGIPNKSEGTDPASTLTRILAHFREETLFCRSLVTLQNRAYIVTLFVDPTSRFAYAEFLDPNQRNTPCHRLTFKTSDAGTSLVLLPAAESIQDDTCAPEVQSGITETDARRALHDIASTLSVSDEKADSNNTKIAAAKLLSEQLGM